MKSIAGAIMLTGAVIATRLGDADDIYATLLGSLGVTYLLIGAGVPVFRVVSSGTTRGSESDEKT